MRFQDTSVLSPRTRSQVGSPSSQHAIPRYARSPDYRHQSAICSSRKQAPRWVRSRDHTRELVWPL
jgi:hypothetical protein